MKHSPPFGQFIKILRAFPSALSVLLTTPVRYKGVPVLMPANTALGEMPQRWRRTSSTGDFYLTGNRAVPQRIRGNRGIIDVADDEWERLMGT